MFIFKHILFICLIKYTCIKYYSVSKDNVRRKLGRLKWESVSVDSLFCLTSSQTSSLPTSRVPPP